MPFCQTSQGGVFYVVSGTGPPLVLLHADGSSGAEFDPVVPQLAEGFQVISIDFPGCGRSPRRAFSNEYYEENAKATLDLVRQVAHSPVFAAGVGGGGVTALWMAVLSPSWVRAVVADSLVEFINPDDLRRDLAAHQNPSNEMVSFWRDMNGEDWGTVVGELDRLLAQIAEEQRSLFDWRLEDVSCPVLLAGSRQDHLISNAGRRLLEIAEQIPSAQLVLYPSGEHPSMWSNAGSFWRDARAFLEDQCGRVCHGQGKNRAS